MRLDVRPNSLLVSPNARHEVPASPDVLSNEASLPSSIGASDVDRTLPLQVPDYLRHCVLRRNRDQHVHVIRGEMPLLDLALSLACQPTKHFNQILPNLPEEHLSPVLRDEHNVELTLPLAVV